MADAITCPYCSAQVRSSRLEQHMAHRCPKRPRESPSAKARTQSPQSSVVTTPDYSKFTFVDYITVIGRTVFGAGLMITLLWVPSWIVMTFVSVVLVNEDKRTQIVHFGMFVMIAYVVIVIAVDSVSERKKRKCPANRPLPSYPEPTEYERRMADIEAAEIAKREAEQNDLKRIYEEQEEERRRIDEEDWERFGKSNAEWHQNEREREIREREYRDYRERADREDREARERRTYLDG